MNIIVVFVPYSIVHSKREFLHLFKFQVFGHDKCNTNPILHNGKVSMFPPNCSSLAMWRLYFWSLLMRLFSRFL